MRGARFGSIAWRYSGTGAAIARLDGERSRADGGRASDRGSAGSEPGHDRGATRPDRDRACARRAYAHCTVRAPAARREPSGCKLEQIDTGGRGARCRRTLRPTGHGDRTAANNRFIAGGIDSLCRSSARIGRTAVPAAPSALDLEGLTQRLRDTKAIGVFTKLTLKNQVDDLLAQFREVYQGQAEIPMAELRQRYELLLLKVLTLLQDGDRQLADAITASREAIGGILADPQRFAEI